MGWYRSRPGSKRCRHPPRPDLSACRSMRMRWRKKGVTTMKFCLVKPSPTWGPSSQRRSWGPWAKRKWRPDSSPQCLSMSLFHRPLVWHSGQPGDKYCWPFFLDVSAWDQHPPGSRLPAGPCPQTQRRSRSRILGFQASQARWLCTGCPSCNQSSSRPAVGWWRLPLCNRCSPMCTPW